MKWFDRWFSNKCKQAWENNSKEVKLSTISPREEQLNSNGMNFTVYRASGGHIVEYRVFDRKNDRHNSSLHIITDDKNLGEEIGKIITFEHLRS